MTTYYFEGLSWVTEGVGTGQETTTEFQTIQVGIYDADGTLTLTPTGNLLDGSFEEIDPASFDSLVFGEWPASPINPSDAPLMSFGYIEWGGNTSYVVAVDTMLDADTRQSQIFVIGGDPIPVSNQQEFEEFGALITDIGAVESGPFAPGQPLDLSQGPGVQISENDLFGGSDGDDALDGGVGDDFIFGFAGDDTLSGGTGENVFVGGAGNDVFLGGAEHDSISYAIEGRDGGPGGVVVNFETGIATDSYGNTDQLISIEGVSGTFADDTIIGSDSTAGAIKMRGYDGSDTFIGGSASFDTVDYTNEVEIGGHQGVSVNLRTGIAVDAWGNTDSLTEIDRIRGTALEDQLIGDDRDNVLEGNEGDDQILGGGGDDRIIGGAGRDIVAGGSGSDSFVFSAGSEVDAILGFDTTEDLFQIDSSTGVTSLSQLAGLVSVHAGYTVLDFGDGDVAVFVGVVNPLGLIDNIEFI